MSEHYTLNTVSAAGWCARCQKETQHRIDRGRKGPCLNCIDKLEIERARSQIEKQRSTRQQSLWG